MALQLEVWQWISLLVTIIASVVGTIKILWKRIEDNLDNNFKFMQMKLEDLANKAEKNQEDIRKLDQDIRDMERRFSNHQIELPHSYVARDDYIRGQTVIESKLDAVADKLENVQIKQGIIK